MRSEESMKAIEPLIARPKTAGLLVIGFKAWAVPGAPESELGLREQLAPGSTRAVWNLLRSRDARIAVTATEHASVRDALRALAQELEGNQLATLPRGPEEVGEISFVHPPEAPPAIFFVTGNLTIGVFSFGREPVDVLPAARSMDADLRKEPQASREGGIDVFFVEREVHVKPKWEGPDGYLKVISPSSDLRKEGDTITGIAEQDAHVYYIEPGRETYGVNLRP
jgi:hypothetical protein